MMSIRSVFLVRIEVGGAWVAKLCCGAVLCCVYVYVLCCVDVCCVLCV